MKSLKRNLLLLIFAQVSGLLFVFISMSFGNKVLGAEAIGEFEYLLTITNYFIILSSFGVPSYALIKIASSKTNDRQLNVETIGFISILMATTSMILAAIYFIVAFRLLGDYNYALFLILSVSIILSNFGCEWYFQGTERQSFITKRQIVVKILGIALLVLFVKSREDLILFGIIYVIASFGANLVNIVFLLHRIKLDFSHLSEFNYVGVIKSTATIFLATIAINIYSQLDYLMLGNYCGKLALGYYSAAYKIVKYATIMILSVNSVLIARLSYYKINDAIQYNLLLNKVVNIIILVALPISLFIFLFAEEIILITADKSFIPSIFILKILSPLVLIITLLNAFVFYILYLYEKQKIFTFAVGLSAIFSLLSNIIFTPHYGIMSTSIISLISESIALVTVFLFISKRLNTVKVFDYNYIKILCACIFPLICLLFLKNNFSQSLLNFIICSILGCFIYAISLYALKEKMTVYFINYIKTLKK